MKSVLISIQPKWCELIAKGIIIGEVDFKSVEVRKAAPKLETPFKVYIYCTKSGAGLIKTVALPMHVVGRGYNNIKLSCYKDYKYCLHSFGCDCVNGKVIGEFVCDSIDTIAVYNEQIYAVEHFQQGILQQSCLTLEEMKAYLGSKNIGYAWHISNLKIYDKPKELGEFKKPCPQPDCVCGITKKCNQHLMRPPQSWCYVEEIAF